MKLPSWDKRAVIVVALVAVGTSTLGYAALQPALAQPVWVMDLPSHIGEIDGDRSDERSFRVFNPHRTKVDLEVIAPGCGCDGRAYQRVIVPPFSVASVLLVTDPSKLPVGPQSQEVILRGFVGDDTFRVTRPLEMTIRRPEVENPRPKMTVRK